MKSPIDTLLRMDLVAIAIGYNIPRQISVPVLEVAIEEMKRLVEAEGEAIRHSDISAAWGRDGRVIRRKRSR